MQKLGKELDAILFLVRHLLILKEMARGLESLMKSLEVEGSSGATGIELKGLGAGTRYGLAGKGSGFAGGVNSGEAGGLNGGGGGGVTGAFRVD